MAADYDQLFQPPEDSDPQPRPQRNGHDVVSAPPDAAGPTIAPTSDARARPMPVDRQQRSSNEPQRRAPEPPKPPAAPRPPEPPAAPRPPEPPAHHGRHARHRNDDSPPAPGGASILGPNARTAPLRRARGRTKTERGGQGNPRSDADRAGDGLQRAAESPPAQRSSRGKESHSARAVSDVRVVRATGKTTAKTAPQRGWRRWVHVVTRVNLGPSPDEKYELELRNRIRRSPRGSYQIAVLGLKGGAGKTAVTVALGSVLAQVRGDRILVVDADAGSGDLAERVGRQSAATIADLLGAKGFAHYNDVRSFTSMNAVNLEVLAGDDYSEARRALNDKDWLAAVETLSRFYNLVLADCGNSLFDPATTGVLSTASGVVIVGSASVDGVRQAAVTIDWLRRNGFHELLSRSCVVINQVVPGKPGVVTKDLTTRFEQHVKPGRVVILPWDPHIAAGTAIGFDHLGRTYRRRVLEMAAALSDDFERAQGR